MYHSELHVLREKVECFFPPDSVQEGQWSGRLGSPSPASHSDMCGQVLPLTELDQSSLVCALGVCTTDQAGQAGEGELM